MWVKVEIPSLTSLRYFAECNENAISVRETDALTHSSHSFDSSMIWHWFFHPKTILFISKSPVYQGFNRYLTVKPHEIHHIDLKASALGRPSSLEVAIWGVLRTDQGWGICGTRTAQFPEIPSTVKSNRSELKGLWRAFEGPLMGRVFVRQPFSDCGKKWDHCHARTARRRPWSFQICRPSNGLPRTSVTYLGHVPSGNLT